MELTVDQFAAVLRAHEACDDSLEWLSRQSTAANVWANCRNAWWFA